MEIDNLQLLCDEELPLASPSPHFREKRRRCDQSPTDQHFIDEDFEQIFQIQLRKEHEYKPLHGYGDHLRLSVQLGRARTKAVRWVISAVRRHSLSYGTAFTAVNYLDRFISINCSIKWEGWMVELLCLACISIAWKMDDLTIPSLKDLQTKDLDHMFEPSTIQRMELAVLKALDWRLKCVTPYSYVHLLVCQLASPTTRTLTTRIAQLLLHALLDTRLVERSAFAIATSAVRCIIAIEAKDSILTRMIPKERMVEVEICSEIMDKYIGSGSWEKWCECFPLSPVTVLPVQRTKVLDCHVDIDGCFSKGSVGPDKSNTKKRQWFVYRDVM